MNDFRSAFSTQPSEISRLVRKFYPLDDGNAPSAACLRFLCVHEWLAHVNVFDAREIDWILSRFLPFVATKEKILCIADGRAITWTTIDEWLVPADETTQKTLPYDPVTSISGRLPAMYARHARKVQNAAAQTAVGD